MKTIKNRGRFEEIKSLRGESVKHFKNGRGEGRVEIYASPVFCKDEKSGEFEEIDCSLKETGNGFENVNGGFKVSYRKDLSGDTVFSLSKDKYGIVYSLKPKYEEIEVDLPQEQQEPSSNFAPLQEHITAQTLEAVNDITAEDVLNSGANGFDASTNIAPDYAASTNIAPDFCSGTNNADSLSDAALAVGLNTAVGGGGKIPASAKKTFKREKCVCKACAHLEKKENGNALLYKNYRANTDLEYITKPLGVKENIIINEKSEAYEYEFELELANLRAEISADKKTVKFLSEENTAVFEIPAPYMFDANGNTSEDVYFEACDCEESGCTDLKVIASAAWINAPERAFPVTVDPEITYRHAYYFDFVSKMRQLTETVENAYYNGKNTVGRIDSVNHPGYEYKTYLTLYGSRISDIVNAYIILGYNNLGLTAAQKRALLSSKIGAIKYKLRIIEKQGADDVVFDLKRGGVIINSFTVPYDKEYLDVDITDVALDMISEKSNAILELCCKDVSASGNYYIMFGAPEIAPTSTAPKTGFVFLDSDYAPSLGFEYRAKNNYYAHRATEEISTGAAGDLSLDLATGFVDFSIADLPATSGFPLGISQKYNSDMQGNNSSSLYQTNLVADGAAYKSGCGNGFKLNVSQWLKKSVATENNVGDIYVDGEGKEHIFYETYYYMEGNVKTEILKEDVNADSEGNLIYGSSGITYVVKREVKTDSGLHLEEDFKGFKNSDTLELRAEEVASLEEEVDSLENGIEELDYNLKELEKQKKNLLNAPANNTGVTFSEAELYNRINEVQDKINGLSIMQNQTPPNLNSVPRNDERYEQYYQKLIYENKNSLYIAAESQRNDLARAELWYNVYKDGAEVNSDSDLNLNARAMRFYKYKSEGKNVRINDGNDNATTDFNDYYARTQSMTEAKRKKMYAVVKGSGSDGGINDHNAFSYRSDAAQAIEDNANNLEQASWARQKKILELQRYLNDLTAYYKDTDYKNRQKERTQYLVKYYTKQLEKYQKQLKTKQNQLKRLKILMPVDYIADDSGNVMGFNEYGWFTMYQTSKGQQYIIGYSLKDNRIEYIADEKEKIIKFEYNNDQLLKTISDSRGRKVGYLYNSGGYLTQITHADGEVCTYSYACEAGNTINYRLTKAVDSIGRGVSVAYTGGKATSIAKKARNITISDGATSFNGTEKEGNTLTLAYAVNTTTATDKNNNATVYRFDSEKRPVEITAQSQGTVTAYTYDQNSGKLLRTQTTDALGNTDFTATEYNAEDLPVKITTKNSRLEVAYNADKKPIRQDLAVLNDNGSVKNTYYSTTDYGINGEVVRTRDYNGIITESSYDAQGKIEKSVSYHESQPSDKYYSESIFDDKGRVIKEAHPLGDMYDSCIEKGAIVYGYDENGNITQIKSGNQAVGYGYDSLGSLKSVSASDGESTNTNTLSYTKGLMTKASSGGTTYLYSYDGFGRVTGLTIAGQTAPYVSYTYENNGTVYSGKVTKTLGGYSTTSLYNAKGELTDVKEGDTTIQKYAYTADGNLLSVKNAAGNTGYTYSYDHAKDLVLSEEYRENGAVKSNTVNEYTNDKLTKATVTANGRSIVYNYGYSASQEGELISAAGGAFKSRIERDALGRLKSGYIDNGSNNVLSNDVYYLSHGDRTSDLVSSVRYGVNGDIADRTKYSYDVNGNITEVRENGKLTVRYGYDSLNRLVREDNKRLQRTYTFAYDAGGNIISRGRGIFSLADEPETVEVSCCYRSAWKDQLTSYNGYTFEYDNAGNPTSYKGKTLVWEKGRQLKSYDGLQFSYDLTGKRTAKGSTSYYYSGDKLILEKFGNSTLEFLYGLDGVAGLVYNGARYYFRKNIQGDVTHVYDANGILEARYVYDAWGNHKIYDGAGHDVTDGTFTHISGIYAGEDCYCGETYAENGQVTDYTNHISHINPIRYRGYYYDESIGLYYLQSRYYDPELGRFLNADDVSYLEPERVNGLNLYAYCGNNAVMNVDPTGHAWWNPFSWNWKQIGGAIGSAVNTAWNTVTNAVGSAWNAITGAATSVANWVSNAANSTWNFVVGAGQAVGGFFKNEVWAPIKSGWNVMNGGAVSENSLLGKLKGLGQSAADWLMSSPYGKFMDNFGKWSSENPLSGISYAVGIAGLFFPFIGVGISIFGILLGALTEIFQWKKRGS